MGTQPKPRIVLYGPRQAPFTEKVRLALALKGLDFELCEPESPEDYRRWNPETGLLPVVDLDGERVADSTAILHRLDEIAPDPPLLANDPLTANQQRQLEDWADESFLWYFQTWLRTARRAEGPPVRSGDGRPLAEAPDRLPVWWRRLLAWLRAGGTWERPETAILRSIGDRLDDLQNFLGARPFFYSDRVSMADLAVYSMLRTMRSESIPGSSRLLAARPPLVEYMARVERATGAS